MSDDNENISPGEYIRGIKNGNIDPTYDNAVKAILWAADEIERLRRTLQLHAGDVASLSGELDEWRERALAAEAEIERLREVIQRIASKNDLSGVSDDDLCSAACNALYDCELIAREALKG